MCTQTVSSARGGPGVAGRDLRLDRIGTGAAEFLGPIERSETMRDQQPVPASTILLVERDDLTIGPGAGAKAGRLDLHQRHEGMRLGLAGRQGGEHAAKAHRLLAQLGARPPLAGRGCVAIAALLRV
jgi:hypothetical protein